MSGDFGAIRAMQDALKANKALLGERIRYFDRGNQFSEIRKAYRKASKNASPEKRLSKEELAEIRKRVIRARRRDERIKLSVFVGVVLMVAVGVFVSRDILFPKPNAQTVVNTKKDQENRERFLYCINDGDKWLKKHGWHNAIFQYREALKLYPENLVAKHRLTIAYTYRCRAEGVDCDNAKESISELIRLQPDSAKNYELLASYYFGIKDSISANQALSEAEKRLK